MSSYQILLNYQKRINKEISRFFAARIKRARSSFEREVLGWLKEYSLRPAKRLRPVLVNLGYALAGGEGKKKILVTSIFIELIHNYLLIHDDILDQDKLRRGKKTLHLLHGEDMAICAGDLACALAYEILSSAKFPFDCRIRALEKLNRALYFTGYGQMLELELRRKKKSGKKISKNEVLDIYRHKTAFYTFVCPLQVGASLAGADDLFLKKIEKFALPLGIAFQIQDDIKDNDVWPILNAEKLVAQAKRVLNSEKSFPRREKQLLLDLADYIVK